MKVNLKTLRKLSLTLFMIPGLSHSFSTEALNDSVCSNMIKRKESSNHYIVHRPLTYKHEGNHYFLQKNKFFSLSNNGGEGTDSLSIDEYAVDFLVKENSLWTLGKNLIERDLMTGEVLNKYPTAPKEFSGMGKAKGFHQLGDKIYIAHGYLGLVVFDLSQRKFVHTDRFNAKKHRGYPSELVSISGESPSQLFIAMSSWRKGFEGIAVYNASSKRVVHKMAYDKRRSGNVGPDTKIYQRGESVFLNNGGWIHAFLTKNILRYRTRKATWLPIAEDVETPDHHGRLNKLRKYRMIKGDFIFKDNQIMGCTQYMEKVDGLKRPLTKAKVVSFSLRY